MLLRETDDRQALVEPALNAGFWNVRLTVHGLSQPTLMRVSDKKTYSGTSRLRGAGPTRTRPAVSYCEPWQWHSQPPYSPCTDCGVLASGVQPRCVHTPTSISHSGLAIPDDG